MAEDVSPLVWVVVEYSRRYEFVDSIWTNEWQAAAREQELNDELNKDGSMYYGAHYSPMRLNTKKVRNGPIGSV